MIEIINSIEVESPSFDSTLHNSMQPQKNYFSQYQALRSWKALNLIIWV